MILAGWFDFFKKRLLNRIVGMKLKNNNIRMNILIHLLKLSILSIPVLFLSHVSSREHQQLGMCNKIYQSRSKNAIISMLPLRLLTSSCSTESLTRGWSILSFPRVNINCAADKTQIHISNRRMQSEHHVSLMSNKWDGWNKKTGVQLQIPYI